MIFFLGDCDYVVQTPWLYVHAIGLYGPPRSIERLLISDPFIHKPLNLGLDVTAEDCVSIKHESSANYLPDGHTRRRQ